MEEPAQLTTEGLRVLVSIADDLSSSPDIETVYRRVVELARSRLNVERCAVFINKNGIFCGTYGTDFEGHTTDEHASTITPDRKWMDRIRLGSPSEPRWHVDQEKHSWYSGDKRMIFNEGWVVFTPILRADGNVLGVFCNDSAISRASVNPLLQDYVAVFCTLLGGIIERKQNEQQLKSLEFEKTAILDSMSELVVYQDLNHRIMWVNRAAAESVNATPEQLIGRYCYEVWHGRHVPCETCGVGKARMSGESHVTKVTSPDNKHWIIRGYPVKNDKGEVVALIEVTEDITGRIQAEASFSAEKERLAVTLRSIGDAVIATDPDGLIVLMNRVAEKITGWSQDQAIGKPLAEVLHVVDERTRQPQGNPVRKAIDSGILVEFPAFSVLLAKDGTERIIADSCAPIRDRESKIIGAVMVFRDITEKRKLEDEVIKAQKFESIGLLAGGIAHDFNNILTAIIGSVSLAKVRAAKGNDVLDLLEELEKASMRAKDLTHQLLSFSKSGAPLKKVVSLEHILKDPAGFALRGSNVQCEFTLQPNLQTVEADEGQIGQVVQNLAINAREAMPNGGTIHIAAENVDIRDTSALPLKPGPYVKVSVRDEGTGIAEADLKKIFDPYFTTKQRGSGLGLTTTYSIVRKHDGHITVESRLGQGTTFIFYLPACGKPAAAPKQADVAPVSGKGRILLMDDEATIRALGSRVLASSGYEVELAEEGADAVAKYKKALEGGRPFDLVILDLSVIRGMGGKEAIGKLREVHPEVKAIVSSGYSTDPVMSDYKTFGFSSLIAKPYSVRELTETIHRVITSG